MRQSPEFLRAVIEQQERTNAELKRRLQEEQEQNEWLAGVANHWMIQCIKEADRVIILGKQVQQYRKEVEELGAMLNRSEL